MKPEIQINLTKQTVHALTEGYVMSQILDARGSKASFTLPELLGSSWSQECVPFYNLYETDRTAGCEMGKLLARVGRKLNLVSKKEDRRGKKEAITRYYF